MMNVASFVCNVLKENTYIVYDETQECVIIDAGCVSNEEKREIQDFISGKGLKIKYLLNTHLHLDHCVGANFITQTYGVKLRVNQQDYSMIDKMKHLLDWFGIKEEDFSVELGESIQENESISFGNSTLIALSVPGHSPGSMVFYEKKEGILFSGDVLFRGSIGRSDLFGGNQRDLLNGIKNKISTLPENTIVYPGHGESTTIKEEKTHNPFIQA
ncbi:MAG TPA: MBL fold hydrolase [Porphyromonadaceae bacterium]|nr:MBL fold hydrolase [Porphyromonadaceae bacterium]